MNQLVQAVFHVYCVIMVKDLLQLEVSNFFLMQKFQSLIYLFSITFEPISLFTENLINLHL